MLGQFASMPSSVSSADSRVFLYEVEGLKQSEETEGQSYAVRKSSTMMIPVPYNRMNSEMRRISRLGGRIVKIHPLAATQS